MPRAEWGVLIADDEPAARRGVRLLLADFPQFAVVGESRNGVETLAMLEAMRPHVVFLDIQMPGIDGFEVIRRRTPERMPAVVFLTAYHQFALEAFEVQAFDYLVKPVTEARFAATMKRLIRQLTPAPPSREEVLVVTGVNGTTLLRPVEIDWIEAEDNYARVWVADRSYLLREALSTLEHRLRGAGFLRAHRKALVRTAAVRELRDRDGGLVAVLGRGVEIPISRRRRAVFARAVRGNA